MFKRTFAALLLLVSLLAPVSLGSGLGRDEQPSFEQRIIRFFQAIPPMFVVKIADDLTIPHP